MDSDDLPWRHAPAVVSLSYDGATVEIRTSRDPATDIGTVSYIVNGREVDSATVPAQHSDHPYVAAIQRRVAAAIDHGRWPPT